MKQYCLIFDVDGTLVNSNAGFIIAIQESFKKVLNIFVNEDEIYKEINNHISLIIKYFVPKIGAEDEKALILFYRDIYQRKYKHYVSLYPNVRSVLQKLSVFSFMGTATNLPTKHVKRLFTQFALGSYFQNIKGTDDFDRPKPSAEILYSTMDMFDINTENCYMIGDSENDIYAGKNAGIKTIAIDYEKNRDYKSNPDYIIHSFEELLKLIMNK